MLRHQMLWWHRAYPRLNRSDGQSVPSCAVRKERRWIMNKEVLAKCGGPRTWQHGALLRAELFLALVVSCPPGPALRAEEHTSDAVTQVCVLIGPAPVFQPLRGWAELPQPRPPRGFVKLPVACNAGKKAPRIWLCYKRGPVPEHPLVAIQVAIDCPLESSGFEQ